MGDVAGEGGEIGVVRFWMKEDDEGLLGFVLEDLRGSF